jgi:predicted Fe-Mo cluster-binding NifX family protein
MKICIPTLDSRGLAAPLSEHFGRSPYFTLVDDARGAVEALVNPRARHPAGSCATAELLRGRAVEAVVCRGLGGGAFARLEAMGVPVYLCDSADVASALEDHRRGRARLMGATQACSGHHDHEGCGH